MVDATDFSLGVIILSVALRRPFYLSVPCVVHVWQWTQKFHFVFRCPFRGYQSPQLITGGGFHEPTLRGLAGDCLNHTYCGHLAAVWRALRLGGCKELKEAYRDVGPLLRMQNAQSLSSPFINSTRLCFEMPFCVFCWGDS